MVVRAPMVVAAGTSFPAQTADWPQASTREAGRSSVTESKTIKRGVNPQNWVNSHRSAVTLGACRACDRLGRSCQARLPDHCLFPWASVVAAAATPGAVHTAAGC